MTDEWSGRKKLFVIGAYYRVLRDFCEGPSEFHRGELLRYQKYLGYSRYDECNVHEFQTSDGTLKEWWLGDREPVTLAAEIFELASAPDPIGLSGQDVSARKVRQSIDRRIRSSLIARAAEFSVAHGNSILEVSRGWSKAEEVVVMALPLDHTVRNQIAQSIPELRFWQSERTPHNTADEGFTSDAERSIISFPSISR